jgi:LmbE family N-acetylglucosaminyl deacetylase
MISRKQKNRILVVAPHIDDETLGVGGTMARFAAEGHDVLVVVLAGHGEITEQHPLGGHDRFNRIKDEGAEAMKVLGVNAPIYRAFPVLMISKYYTTLEVNRMANEIVKEIRPDILFVPYLWDVHEDHRIFAEAFCVAWRPCTEHGRNIREVYMYETVSETHWSIPFVEPAFVPNTWFDISDYLTTKLKAMACFKSQVFPPPHARSLEALEALARWRGSLVSVNAAEAFISVRSLK